MIPHKLELERRWAGEPGGSGIRPLVVRSPAPLQPRYTGRVHRTDNGFISTHNVQLSIY